ncbi:MAG TPA: MupA/Atu3671 family FMN-dependent luciferase-like monooxygenase [Pyrinomonadaceae bacterium]
MSEFDIAIVGLAGRFPRARDIEEFWERLRAGEELISFFSDEDLLRRGVDRNSLDDPNYVKAEAVLDGVELFDAAFFGFTAREAETLDPQHRLFLEESWNALENAGYNSETYNGRVGVFAGESLNSYFLHNLYPNRKLLESLGASQTIIGNDRDYLATQVSFRMNLKGPSFSVQTACSTSLVAVHLGCQSLLNHECDLALAGGVSIGVPQGIGSHHQEGGIISPDGHCRAFDARARGTVKGSGLGVVVLKRLADALDDRDNIRAVIKGSAINNDGAVKVGYTAPAVAGQASVIEETFALASIEPETIGYVEAHGTGTVLGDPIEIAALTNAFNTETRHFCAIGSVKTNIGHLDAAAGVAGLIKTILALEHKEIPPSLHFEQPNPNIDFANSPFFVNTELRSWSAGETPRRAGVSSFGIGGTNAHVLLEEAPASMSSKSVGPYLLVLSARTQSALDQATKNLARHLERNSDINLADVAYTLSVGRRAFEHRLALVCRDREDAIAKLISSHRSQATQYSNRPVAFMFPGQGAQYVDMGRELYEREQVFREELDHCAELLHASLGVDLREIIYAKDLSPEDAAVRLADTRFAQPALFCVEYALAKLWSTWGVVPRAMLGHSIGEYVAACLAGVFSPADALKLVAARGEIMARQPRGAMLAVSLGPNEVEKLLSEQVSLAAINSPSLCVLSGTSDAVDKLDQQLSAEGVISRRLHTSHAFHSAMMEPAMAEFAAVVAKVKLHPPQKPYLSNVTGTWITDEQAIDPQYWSRHLREAVQFSAGVAKLLDDPALVLLEVGPGQTLSTLAAQHSSESIALASLRPSLLKTVRQLWVAGVEIDWTQFYTDQRRVPLPTYPFERRRYWIDPPSNRPDPIKIEPVSETLPLCGKPSSNTESLILDIWRDLFGLETIHPEDNFSDLGGNSLIALQLVAQLRSTFKIDLPLRVIFESQTASVLAARISELLIREVTELENLALEFESPAPEELQRQPEVASRDDRTGSINFSLYFFSDDGSKASDDKYHLVLESAKFADRNGFTAVWTPERHFQDFGGLYPNPSVLSAALAVLTERIQIRAGSVALPLHHPVRVAEEWSLVDNLSHGRVGLSFASGWHSNDFIFAPHDYDDRKEVMFRHIELIQKLWAGEKVKLPTTGGEIVEVKILPRPLQRTLPIWITSSGNKDTWRRAGAIGANILAAYVGYSPSELAQLIKLYRDTRATHGHDPYTGVVTIMLHTFVGADDAKVKETVRAPFSNYLRTYFKQYENVAGVTEADRVALMDAAFEKYYEASTLLGTPAKCARLIDTLVEIGVDEIACLVDFGVAAELMLESLMRLDELRARYAKRSGEKDQRSALQPIPRRPQQDTNVFLTSIDQERLWFIDQLQPGNAAYNIFSASRIRGPLDERIMERVIRELIARHEVLRTTFTIVDDEPMQVINPEVEFKLETIDLQSLPLDEREREAMRLVTETFSAPFDLEKGPLFRVGLIRLAADDHVLHQNMHHTVTDRWSGAIFEQETGLLYEAFAKGEPSPLPPLPIQYADYSLWQRSLAESETYHKQAEYWKRRLTGAPYVLEVPADFPRPPLQNFRGARVYTRYAKRLLEALRELSRREGVTMFTLALAAYKSLLYRYTSQSQLLVGTTFANRNRPELQNMVGYLLNLIVLSTDVTGNPTFRELLQRERVTVLEGFANQDLPFGKLVQELRPAQDASRNPIVQHSLIYLDFPELTIMDTLGLSAKHLDVDNGASRFDMTLAMTETDAGYEVDIEYPTDLYRRERIERMAQHLENILEAIVVDSNLRLSELPLLSAAEERQLLIDWNDTSAAHSNDRFVHELFEAQVERTPDNVALVFENETLTYRELNEYANRLARHLAQEELIGLFMPRSSRAIVGLLAILKVGAAYLPLDEKYPAERLSFMLQDSGVRVVLTEAGVADKLPQFDGRIVRYDDEWNDSGSLERPLTNEQRAYVIYTSGSTGQPKGVEVPHRSVVNLLHTVLSQISLTATDTMLSVSTLSFDVATAECFLPLITGGRLVIANREVATDGLQLAALVKTSGATVMQGTPALWRMLVDADWQGDSRLKVFTAGEPLDPLLADQLLARCGELWNLYGPTETTIYSGIVRIMSGTGPVPVGPPVANTRFYVVDQFMNPVPIGIYGELLIGGAGLAHGYLRRPDLTAEKFVPDPFGAEAGARLYRTGDLVRYLEDGKLEFAGRLDHQVKVRGFRIELGEIEVALSRHPAVRSAVVHTQQVRPGEQRLIAYVVGSKDVPTPGEWRSYLMQRLPEYMIPSLFIELAELPLLPNGKVNRNALPVPDASRPELNKAFVAPENPTQARLVEIWMNVLGIDRVGIHDNFFELGGDSILATRLVSRVRRTFGVELPLRELFWKTTVFELAAAIEDLVIEQLDNLSDEEAEQLLQNGL